VKDFSGRASYDVAYTIAPKDEPTESTLLAGMKRDLSDDSHAEFRQLDVSKVKAGTYLLTVTVTDKKRVQTLTRTREIEITK
jgi:hypothetical protein